MTVMAQASPGMGTGSRGGLYDTLELILDKGIVIDALVRISLIGIELIRVEVRVVIASVDTYLRFAAAMGQLELAQRASREPLVQTLPGTLLPQQGELGTAPAYPEESLDEPVPVPARRRATARSNR